MGFGLGVMAAAGVSRSLRFLEGLLELRDAPGQCRHVRRLG